MTKQIIVYAPDEKTHIEVKTDGETVWLTQAQICQLLGRERSVITKHINNAIREGEVSVESNVQILHIPTSDKPVKLYDLDVVISVGYRVKSIQGTLFRRWATHVLREMLLRRLDDVKRIGKIERRMDAVENDIRQIKGGMNYFVKQLSAPDDMPRKRIGFGAKEGETLTRPYGKSNL